MYRIEIQWVVVVFGVKCRIDSHKDGSHENRK